MLRSVWIVFRKELLDVMRDRRTLIFMLLVPTVAIPALIWLTTELLTSFSQKLAREKVNVLVLNPQAAPQLLEEVKQRSNPVGRAAQLAGLLKSKGLSEQELSLFGGEEPGAFLRLLKKRGIDPEQLSREARDILQIPDMEPSPKDILSYAFPPNFQLITELPAGLADPNDPVRREEVLLDAVRRDRIAAAIRFADDAREKLSQGEAAEVWIYYSEASDRSEMAKDGILRILKDTGATIVAERLREKSLPVGFASPVRIHPAQLPGPGLLVRLMGQLLPYMIILFAFLGAMYPAIDLGAGEKERGTIETLLVAPVSRLAIMLGKFGVILVAALVSAVLSTASLAISLQAGFLSTVALVSGGSFTFTFSEALTALLVILPIGCVFASLLLAISMFAKSFKEAQSYASPLQTIIILPAFVSMLPGIKLDWVTSSIPVANVTLALKEIFTGNLDQHWGHIGVIFLSTTVFAGLLLWFATWWARRESVLFRS